MAQEAAPPEQTPPAEAPEDAAVADVEQPAETTAEPPSEPTDPEPPREPGAAASALAAPNTEPTAPPPAPVEDEFSELDDESPPGQPSAQVLRDARARPRPTNDVGQEEDMGPPRFWRMPRAGTMRPQTLPQGVMHFRSTIAMSMQPAGTGGQFHGSAFFGYGVGIFDDLEIGTNPFGLTFLFSFHDPSFYLRARIVSGEVQFSLRGEWTIPLSSNGSAWMGYSAELAWTPVDWFRFETALEYGLHFSTPLQQTVFVPVRALLQAGPNTFGLTSGLVMYNDADDFDVPLYLRYAVAFGGHQGPLSEPAIEGGFADLSDAANAWFIRFVWTFFAYP